MNKYIYINIMDQETSFIRFLEENTQIKQTEDIQKMINYFKNQIKFKKQTDHYKDKIQVTISFIKFIESICKSTYITVFGSFTRNLIEKIFMSSAENGFGDPINHDIDIIIYNDKFSFNNNLNNFNDLISLFKIISHNDKFDFNFHGYKLIDICDKTLEESDLEDTNGFGKKFMLNIPHFVIIFKKDNFIIKFDLLGYKVTSESHQMEESWHDEFNVNSLSLTKNGIFVTNLDIKNYDFFNIINNILKREVVCNLPFDTILDDFINKNTRISKVQILNQIIWFMLYRTKILTLGYNKITSDRKFFDYIIEKEELCDLTNNLPPYIKLKLKCTHYISLMGLIGIVNIPSSEWSEAIKCPYCRTDLNLELIDIKPLEIIIPEEPKKELIMLNDYEITETINSDDNINYISHILNKKETPQNLTNNITAFIQIQPSIISRYNRDTYISFRRNNYR